MFVQFDKNIIFCMIKNIKLLCYIYTEKKNAIESKAFLSKTMYTMNS